MTADAKSRSRRKRRKHHGRSRLSLLRGDPKRMMLHALSTVLERQTRDLDLAMPDRSRRRIGRDIRYVGLPNPRPKVPSQPRELAVNDLRNRATAG